MSTTKELLNESYCHIFYDEQDGIIHAEWKGFLKPDQVRKGCSVMTDYIKKHKLKEHLSDHRQLKVLTKDVQAYLTEQWFPEVEKAGLTKVAALVSDDVFAKATVDNVNTTAKVGGLVIKTFNSHKDCKNWLNGVEV